MSGRILPVSDETLAALFAERLRGGRAFQFFARRLGPNDVIYVSAQAWGRDNNHVEARASAMRFEDALVELFLNLDHATTRTP